MILLVSACVLSKIHSLYLLVHSRRNNMHMRPWNRRQESIHYVVYDEFNDRWHNVNAMGYTPQASYP